MSKPTPITGGAWRVINGDLVDESIGGTPIEQVAEPLIASTEEREGGPGIPVPPIDQPSNVAQRRTKHKP